MERKQVAHWMRLRVDDYVDGCGEVNCTKLAEDAADALDIYEDRVEYAIPEFVFEVAFETSEWLKKQSPVRRFRNVEVRRDHLDDGCHCPCHGRGGRQCAECDDADKEVRNEGN